MLIESMNLHVIINKFLPNKCLYLFINEISVQIICGFEFCYQNIDEQLNDKSQ